MSNIDGNSSCLCGSGKQYKDCCRIPDKLKQDGFQIIDEDYALGNLLNIYPLFRRYFEQEKLKIQYPLYWLLKDTLTARASSFFLINGTFGICFKEIPSHPSDAYMIAHEMQHLILIQDGYVGADPKVKYFNEDPWPRLVSNLNSTLCDFLVDSTIQKFGFNVKDEYLDEIASNTNSLLKYPLPIDRINRIRLILDYIDKKLYNKYVYPNEYDIFRDYFTWFSKTVPDIVNEAERLFYKILVIGLDTPEKYRKGLQILINHFNLNDYMFISKMSTHK